MGDLRQPALALAGVVLLPLAAVAIDLERLVMPGEVSEAHAKIEGDCGKCHQRLRQTDENALCLDCHEEVGADRAAGTGFHGRSPSVQGVDCRACHVEHRGRDADLLGLEPTTFDHGLSDFALEGAHTAVACSRCHAAGKAFREAPGDCIDCHEDDDPHRGRLGRDCASCHTVDGWPHTRFDHSTTGFPLEGRHTDVSCEQCHPQQRWKETPNDCQDCHRLQDTHQGRFGPACGECHTPAGWTRTGFDHDRDTRFPLRGAHRGADCHSCHAGDPRSEKLSMDCASCHANDDAHRGRNGPACDRCHGSVSWSPSTFDHDRDTKFALRGSHETVRCEQCHPGPPYDERVETDCYACHRLDDVHVGQQGRDCDRCHREQGWADEVFFDHEITLFPLLGMHAVAACEECHDSPAFKDADTKCVSCHRDDDTHEGRLGASCQLCHNPNDWRIWHFDHETQTDFPLRGAHASLHCHSCHRGNLEEYVQMGTDCASCHASDDPHLGAFGPDCANCHKQDHW